MFDKGPSYENRRSIAAASAAESSDDCLSRLLITSRRASCLLVPAPPAPQPCSDVLHAHAYVTVCWRICACMHGESRQRSKPDIQVIGRQRRAAGKVRLRRHCVHAA